MSFKIRFLDFPDENLKEKILFISIIEREINRKTEVVGNLNTVVDLEIVSNFVKNPIYKEVYLRLPLLSNQKLLRRKNLEKKFGFRSTYHTKAKKRIWFTGENLVPPIDLFDGTISFAPSDKKTNNLYFPYWLFRLKWENYQNVFEIMPTPEELTQKRTPHLRPLTACTFSSNPEPLRMKLINDTELVFQVEKYGSAFNNSVDSKLKTSSNFGLQICNENSLSPNYVTEKLQEAWFGRNIPIWSGLDDSQLFNTESFIDATKLSSEELVHSLKNLTTEELMFKQSLPLLKSVPTIEPLSTFLSELIL